MPLKTNGSALRRRRELKGFTIEEFARRVDYNPEYISQVELGNGNAGPTLLRKAAELLGCEIADITDGEVPHRGRRRAPASRGAT